MKIKVIDKSTGTIEIPVRRVKPIWSMSDEELIKALDLKKKILDRHYEIEDRHCEVSDIYSDALVEYVAEELCDYCQEPKFDGYEKIASRLISKLEDELVEEINERDNDAKDNTKEVRSAEMGEY